MQAARQASPQAGLETGKKERIKKNRLLCHTVRTNGGGAPTHARRERERQKIELRTTQCLKVARRREKGKTCSLAPFCSFARSLSLLGTILGPFYLQSPFCGNSGAALCVSGWVISVPFPHGEFAPRRRAEYGICTRTLVTENEKKTFGGGKIRRFPHTHTARKKMLRIHLYLYILRTFLDRSDLLGDWKGEKNMTYSESTNVDRSGMCAVRPGGINIAAHSPIPQQAHNNRFSPSSSFKHAAPPSPHNLPGHE